MHVNKLDTEGQVKWMEQRGWVQFERNGMKMYRHPETGIGYNFIVAMRLAKEDCRLPADFELNPK